MGKCSLWLKEMGGIGVLIFSLDVQKEVIEWLQQSGSTVWVLLTELSFKVFMNK